MDAETIAAGLSVDDRRVIQCSGYAYASTHFTARVLGHLERKGLFIRRERKGFSTRWVLTPKGEAVRAIIEKEQNNVHGV